MKIPKGKLEFDCASGDGKSAFIIHTANDGFRDLRIEIDTDDVDSDYAEVMAQELIRRWNIAEKK